MQQSLVNLSFCRQYPFNKLRQYMAINKMFSTLYMHVLLSMLGISNKLKILSMSCQNSRSILQIYPKPPNNVSQPQAMQCDRAFRECCTYSRSLRFYTLSKKRAWLPSSNIQSNKHCQTATASWRLKQKSQTQQNAALPEVITHVSSNASSVCELSAILITKGKHSKKIQILNSLYCLYR